MTPATWPTAASGGRKLGWCSVNAPPEPTNIIRIGATGE
jgi:hypothetical protein